MTKIQDGGPAYPVVVQNTGIAPIKGFDGDEIAPLTQVHYGGMTLRDYYAGLALTAIIRDKEEQSYWVQDYSLEECAQFTAERAYSFADAMIQARKAAARKWIKENKDAD